VLQSLALAQTSDTLALGLAEAIDSVRAAETAGARSSDITVLVLLLNKALELNNDARKSDISPDKRLLLLEQVNNITSIVQNKAFELINTSTEETSVSRSVNYAIGVGIALLGTIIYAISIAFYRNLRIRRTFQMRVRRR